MGVEILKRPENIFNNITYFSFEELFDYEEKSKIKAGAGLSEGMYPFFTSSIEQTKFLNEYQFNKESLIFGTGGQASIHFINECFAVSTDCLVTFAKDSSRTCVKYVYYFLSGNIHVLEEGFKGAGLKHISKSYINSIKIPLPPFPVQKRIVEILDTADTLRRKDQELLKKYDELAQAIFIDMFGDPVKNEKRWDSLMLNSLCTKITDGTHQSPKFTKDGIPFLLVSNIVNYKISYTTNKFISNEEFEILNQRTPIEVGCILLTTVGSYGNPAIIKEQSAFAFQRHIAYIKPNHELINYKYLYSFLKSPLARLQMNRLVNGVAQKTLNLADLKSLKIWNIPRSLQDEYARIFDNIELEIESSEFSKSDNLFNSLLQKAFKGELLS
jgi:type I restriction enzyme S subunit